MTVRLLYTEEMRIPRGYIYIIASVCLILIIFTLWDQITEGKYQMSWTARYLNGPVTINNHTTTNCGETQCNRTSTCTSVSYYELFNKTLQVKHATLYLTLESNAYGRVGNQMFRYASLLGVSRTQGRGMFIEPGTELEQAFKISYVANVSTKTWSTVYESKPVSFDEKMMHLPLENITIKGYLQSFWYFCTVIDEVRQEFTFRDSVANEAADILRQVVVKYNSSMIVGVHVRRGDFLKPGAESMGYGVPKKSYFMKAFSLMKSKFPGRNITFIVVSDDLPWCSKHLLGNDVIVVPPASPAVHLAVLSSCDHVIISGGSFGWWGGWLANGYVIYYTGYMREGTGLGKLLTVFHYYPRLWTGLDN